MAADQDESRSCKSRDLMRVHFSILKPLHFHYSSFLELEFYLTDYRIRAALLTDPDRSFKGLHRVLVWMLISHGASSQAGTASGGGRKDR